MMMIKGEKKKVEKESRLADSDDDETDSKDNEVNMQDLSARLHVKHVCIERRASIEEFLINLR